MKKKYFYTIYIFMYCTFILQSCVISSKKRPKIIQSKFCSCLLDSYSAKFKYNIYYLVYKDGIVINDKFYHRFYLDNKKMIKYYQFGGYLSFANEGIYSLPISADSASADKEKIFLPFSKKDSLLNIPNIKVLALESDHFIKTTIEKTNNEVIYIFRCPDERENSSDYIYIKEIVISNKKGLQKLVLKTSGNGLVDCKFRRIGLLKRTKLQVF